MQACLVLHFKEILFVFYDKKKNHILIKSA
jgi:hypothetical protein